MREWERYVKRPKREIREKERKNMGERTNKRNRKIERKPIDIQRNRRKVYKGKKDRERKEQEKEKKMG